MLKIMKKFIYFFKLEKILYKDFKKILTIYKNI